jgi:hypothetical protein
MDMRADKRSAEPAVIQSRKIRKGIEGKGWKGEKT